MLEFALLDESVFVPPAAAVYNLLIGKHGAALRTPVHQTFLTIGQPLLVELEKEPLIPAVVVRQTGCDFARPIVGKAETIHLRLHLGDVAESPLARRGVVLNGGVFGGQSE